MHRFYYPHNFAEYQTIHLSNKEEIHHLKDVLRMKAGTSIEIFNGQGLQGTGQIESLTSADVIIKIDTVQEYTAELPSIILACAIPKKGKFETIIEKTTELGVDEIIPLKTKHTEFQLKGDKLVSKWQRYQKVALNAAKQSKRSTVPIIHPVTLFPIAVSALLKRSTVMMPSLTSQPKKLIPALAALNNPSLISFLIGPEGDFTDQEYTLAHEAGCIPVSLGPTILKVETAAITVVAVTRINFNG